MKRLIVAIAVAGSLWGGVTIGHADTVRTYQSGSHETQYVIPSKGTPYCFNPSPDLPVDLPVCPNSNRNGTVAADPLAAPSFTSEP